MIRALIEPGLLQFDLFGERNLLERSSPDYPGERLLACRNPPLATLRAIKRDEVLLGGALGVTSFRARKVRNEIPHLAELTFSFLGRLR